MGYWAVWGVEWVWALAWKSIFLYLMFHHSSLDKVLREYTFTAQLSAKVRGDF